MKKWWIRSHTAPTETPERWTLQPLVLLTLLALNVSAAERDDISALKALSISELMDTHVSTVSRRAQKYSDVAAALFVISREDIRRSGAENIPELLRMVPGVQVAHIDMNKWAISARGFNGRYANKLLVQMDGRTLYSSVYSGVYWDVQDTLLEDIERIEVIRGPGATMWGANAVNGIINIITRSSHDTDGGLLSLATGDEEHASTAFRYGGALGENGSFRLYAKAFNRDGGLSFQGDEAPDDWRNRQIGFRSDLDLDGGDRLTVQGDAYEGLAGASVVTGGISTAEESETSGSNLLARWSRSLGGEDGIDVQFYSDFTRRTNWALDMDLDTFDLDFQHRFSAGRHALVWGAGYRLIRDEIRGVEGSVLDLNPERRKTKTLSAFVQDDIRLFETIHLIIGSKLEHNDYTGSEWQPNLRGLWNASASTTLWASVSRAVRTPSRVETDLVIDSFPILYTGNPALRSESLTAYEAGLRARLAENLSVDLSAYYNRYDYLETTEVVGPAFPLPINLSPDNLMEGDGYGLELVVGWDPTRDWRLKLGYSWLDLDLRAKPGSNDTETPINDDRVPSHQLSLRSMLDLAKNFELDTNLYYVGAIEHTDISSYLRLDLRLGWRPSDKMELSLIGKNLFDPAHPEFVEFSGASSEGLRSTEVERSVLLQGRWRF